MSNGEPLWRVAIPVRAGFVGGGDGPMSRPPKLPYEALEEALMLLLDALD